MDSRLFATRIHDWATMVAAVNYPAVSSELCTPALMVFPPLKPSSPSRHRCAGKLIRIPSARSDLVDHQVCVANSCIRTRVLVQADSAGLYSPSLASSDQSIRVFFAANATAATFSCARALMPSTHRLFLSWRRGVTRNAERAPWISSFRR